MAVVFMITIAVIAVVAVLGCHKRNLSTGAQKGYTCIM